jgi:hypothetical protein
VGTGYQNSIWLKNQDWLMRNFTQRLVRSRLPAPP